MPDPNNVAADWTTQRYYLKAALRHLSAFTDNMQTFLEMSDAEAERKTGGNRGPR